MSDLSDLRTESESNFSEKNSLSQSEKTNLRGSEMRSSESSPEKEKKKEKGAKFNALEAENTKLKKELEYLM